MSYKILTYTLQWKLNYYNKLREDEVLVVVEVKLVKRYKELMFDHFNMEVEEGET